MISDIEKSQQAVLDTKHEQPLPDFKNKNSWRSKFKDFLENITVEPIVACYILPSILSDLASQNLKLEKACRVNLNFGETVCDALTRRDTANYTFEEKEVQKLIASVQTWKTAVQIGLPCMLLLFIGAWSDKTGKRKMFILAPVFGDFLRCIGLIINTYLFYELPVGATALSECVPPALLGGWFTFCLATFAYVADHTTHAERSYRVGIVNLIFALCFPVAAAISGMLLRLTGYYGVFLICTAFYVTSLTYGYFGLKEESKPRKTSETASSNGCIGFFKSFFDLKLVGKTLEIVFKKGENNRRLKVFLLLLCVAVIFGPLQGEIQIVYLFTRYQFNWSELEFSYFQTYTVITSLIGTTLSVSLFTGYFKMEDTLLGIVAVTSKILSSFIFGFAKTTTTIFIAPLIDIFTGTSYTAIRAVTMKLVSNDELGRLNSLFALAEATTQLVYAPAYVKFYAATFEVLPGAVYLLGGVMMIPAIFIYGWLYFETKKRNKDVKEKQDLETTSALLESTKINDEI